MTQTLVEAAARSDVVPEVVELLRSGLPVALPTETVYGLAANACDPVAAGRIFEAKERPLADPLIVHVAHGWEVSRVAEMPARLKGIAAQLIERFWPGPLTLVLPRTPSVPDIVTAGEETVAVRCSAHPFFRSILEAFGGPLAAPSANRFGRVSPTEASHVLEELGGRIHLIVDGGPCTYGVESTIIRIAGPRIEVLRPGPITHEMLGEFAPVEDAAQGRAPGRMASHYAPTTPLRLCDAGALKRLERDGKALLAFGDVDEAGYLRVENLSRSGDFLEAAARLYGALRSLDSSGAMEILATPVPEIGIGRAIMDRLRKAAHG